MKKYRFRVTWKGKSVCVVADDGWECAVAEAAKIWGVTRADMHQKDVDVKWIHEYKTFPGR